MSDYLTPGQLTAGTVLPEDDVTLSNGKVRVRALTRGEVFLMNAARASGEIKTEADWEQHMVAYAMVQPTLTRRQVAAWQGSDLAGGDLEKVTNRISELSGMSEGADKSGVPGTGEGPGDGVRVLPSDEAG